MHRRAEREFDSQVARVLWDAFLAFVAIVVCSSVLWGACVILYHMLRKLDCDW